MDKKLLLDSKHFCIIPFIHSCIWTDGRVIPCCINQEYVLGNAKEDSLEKIYNNDNEKLRLLRKEMINGPNLPQSCNRCGDPEKSFNAQTYRIHANRRFSKFLKDLDFDQEGNLATNKINFWDVRFSNICNLKCRTCDHINSSRIAEEERKNRPDIPIFKEAFDNNRDFFNFFVKNIDYIEEIYFCGGEPLLLAEHYEMLDLLVEHKKFDTLLRYNSNCTVLTYKNKNIIDYWRKFKRITFSASLDAGWEQFEYIRHGGIWDEVVDNLKKIRNICPHVEIEFSPTISILNINYIERLHRFLLEENIIKIDRVYYNILTWPPEFSLTVLPLEVKDQIKLRWQKYYEYIKNLNSNAHTLEKILEVIAYMESENNQELLSLAKNTLENKDKIRNQDYSKTFKDLKEILK